MKINTEKLLSENRELLDIVGETLLEVDGIDYSREQIQKAFTITLLLAYEVFHDVIAKLPRNKLRDHRK